MIKLYFRGGSGGHMLCALLDYCTEEGNLEGYPIFEQGNNMHNHTNDRLLVKNQFYEPYGLHNMPDSEHYKIVNGGYEHDFGNIHIRPDFDQVISPIANSAMGRILILTMSFGKCQAKRLPPDDSFINYHGLTTFEDKLEKVALSTLNVLLMDFREFHGHAYPTYPIDVMWFYNNDYEKISDTIIACGWTPKIEKIKEFCKMVLEFNKPYYDLITNVADTFNNIIQFIDKPCALTFYETSLVHSLMLHHYKIYKPEQIKLITVLPTSTREFINLYKGATV